MPDSTKETITTTETNDNGNIPESKSPKRDATSYQTVSYLVYFVFGLIDVLLGFRFVFKLLGANSSTTFVDFIYGMSAIFVAPFAGIFNTSLIDGTANTSIFEPATLVAIIVYAVLAWGIVALIRVLSGRRQTE